MANKMDNDFIVNVNPAEVMYTSINTSKDGYNSARMVIKKGDNEYMSISYEWEGGGIPGFAMDLMSFMKTNNVETSGIWKDKEVSFAEWASKSDPKALKKEMCSVCGKKKENCTCKKSNSSEDE